MKKSKWKGYAPVLAMASLAVVLGVLTLCGVIDLGTMPQLVADKPALAVLVALGLYALKGISVAVVYHVLVVSVALVFPLPAALVINAVGLVISLTASYLVGRHTDPSDLNGLLDRHPRIKRFFDPSQEMGFASCFVIHSLGLSMEVLGVLFGMLRTGYGTYLVSSWLAIYPGTVCFTILGSRLDFHSPVFWAFLAVNVVMLGYALLYCKRQMSAPGGEMPVDTGKSISSDNNDVS